LDTERGSRLVCCLSEHAQTLIRPGYDPNFRQRVTLRGEGMALAFKMNRRRPKMKDVNGSKT
jgi:hypothetical protein